MFNLFKKSKQEEIITETVVAEYIGKYPLDVEAIHNEFFTASDRALAAAQEILTGEEKKSLEKGKRLLSLGFKQAREAVEVQIAESNIKIAKEIADLILLYKQRYPLHKFVTNEQILEICKKYDLVYGEVSRYRGFVPENKLQQIEGFKPHKEDKNTIIGIRNSNSSLNQPDYIYMQNAEIRQTGSYMHIFKRGDSDNYKYAFQADAYNSNGGFYSADKSNLFGLAHLGNIRFDVLEGLLICAPLKDMDTQGMKVENHRLIKEIPDPVVIYPVKGGGIILAAWGPEQSDPLVINETMN